MRRSDHPLRVLSQLPWWVSVTVAASIFCALRYLAPALSGSRPFHVSLAQLAVAIAPYLAGIFLLPLPFAVARALRLRRLLNDRPALDRLRTMNWQEFERLIGVAYQHRGYRVAMHGGPGADGGVDLILESKGKTLVVQCKRWRTGVVGVELVRELYGAMAAMHAHGAIFVTTVSFTPPAIDFARDKAIELIDGRALIALLGAPPDVPPAVAIEAVLRTPVVTTREGPMRCPRCGAAMARRVAKRGANAGSSFWGCTNFPECKGTREDASSGSLS